ncbi:unnamed protein product [Peniophora sp. CBMAI 1063]|nr:unnamed protein product [Peniophora sp. CBMAI 1063]
MSIIGRAWQRLVRSRYFVGTDLEGNRFFEYPSSTDDPRRTKRRVEYKQYTDMWQYIGRQRSLPVQWTAWLSHTRADPPSIQELQRDMFRRQRLQHNVAQIEARDAAEAARIAEARRMDMLAAPGSAQSQADMPPSIPNSAVHATAMTPGTAPSAHNPGTLPHPGSTVENVHVPPPHAVGPGASMETREPEKIVQSGVANTPEPAYSPNKDKGPRPDLPKVQKDEKWQPESWKPRANVRRGS